MTFGWKALALQLILASGVIACDGTTEPNDDDPEPGTPVSLPHVGQGIVREWFTAEVAARGNYAYTTTYRRSGRLAADVVNVWNVEGSNPALVDTLVIGDADTLGDVQISDDGELLVVATEVTTGSIVVYDLSDPAHPSFLSRHSSSNTRGAGVHTVKLGRIAGALYAFLSVNPGGGHRAQLVVVDLSDPTLPEEILVREMGNPFVHDVFVRDGLLFTALWNDGMTIWDVGGGNRGGSPTSPVQIGNVRTVGAVNPAAPSVHNIWWFHNPLNGEKRYAFVGEEGPGIIGASSSGDIHVVDVSDMANPREVAFYNVPGGGTHNFVMDEVNGILYAAYYDKGVRALDVRGDLSNCTAAQKSLDGRCDLRLMGREAGLGLTNVGQTSIWGVARVGDFLYASDILNGIYKLDISALNR